MKMQVLLATIVVLALSVAVHKAMRAGKTRRARACQTLMIYASAIPGLMMGKGFADYLFADGWILCVRWMGFLWLLFAFIGGAVTVHITQGQLAVDLPTLRRRRRRPADFVSTTDVLTPRHKTPILAERELPT